MKTSSRNIAKLREALQNMYSTEFLQITASGLAINTHFFKRLSGDLIKKSFIICFLIKIKKQPLNAVIQKKSS